MYAMFVQIPLLTATMCFAWIVCVWQETPTGGEDISEAGAGGVSEPAAAGPTIDDDDDDDDVTAGPQYNAPPAVADIRATSTTNAEEVPYVASIALQFCYGARTHTHTHTHSMKPMITSHEQTRVT